MWILPRLSALQTGPAKTGPLLSQQASEILQVRLEISEVFFIRLRAAFGPDMPRSDLQAQRVHKRVRINGWGMMYNYH